MLGLQFEQFRRKDPTLIKHAQTRRSKGQRKRVQGRRFAAESGDLDSLVLDSEDESDEDYEPSSGVPEQYRLGTERLRDIVHGDDDDDDDDYEDIECYSESGYRLVYKDNLVAALQKAHQAGKCKGRMIVVEDSDNIRGSDGFMKLSCELCSVSLKLFNSESSAEKPHSTYDCKNLNARMVMVALESGNSSPLFRLLVEILGLPCKFSESTWGRHVKKFKTAHESAADEVLLKSREKVCDLIPEDDESGLTPVKIGLDGTWAKRGFRSLFGAAFAVALDMNEIIDFGTKSKLNEAIAFAPMKKSSDKFKEHKAKVKENSEAVFEDSVGAVEKEICKDIFNRSEEIRFQYTDLLGDRDSRDYNEVKGIYGMCDECKKYEEKMEEDKEKFDTSKKGLQFWQKHRDKQIKCNSKQD